MRVSDHPADTLERRDFFRSTLSVATSDDDAGCGVRTMNFSHGVASLRVSRSGYSTGIKDDEVGGTVIVNER